MFQHNNQVQCPRCTLVNPSTATKCQACSLDLRHQDYPIGGNVDNGSHNHHHNINNSHINPYSDNNNNNGYGYGGSIFDCYNNINYNNDDNNNSMDNNEIDNDNNNAQFEEAYADISGTCCGECGALFPKLLKAIRDSNDNKSFNQIIYDINNINIIKDHFMAVGFPCRNVLVTNLNKLSKFRREKRFFVNKEEYNYIDSNFNCLFFFNNVFKNEEWLIASQIDCINVMKFLKILTLNKAFIILTKLAKISCKYPQRSLIQECKENIDYDPNNGEHTKLFEDVVEKTIEVQRKQRFIRQMRSRGYNITTDEIMAICLYCASHLISQNLRGSHRLQNTCKWSTLYSLLMSAITKLYNYNKSINKYNNNNSNSNSNSNSNNNGTNGGYSIPHSLYHGCSVNDSNIKMPFKMHTINSFSEKLSVAKGFATNGNDNSNGAHNMYGVVLELTDVQNSLQNGSLIAAPVNDFSEYKQEEEWIVLPITLKSKQIKFESNININQITRYNSIDTSHATLDLDNVNTPLISNFTPEQRRKLMKYYKPMLYTIGMNYKHECQLCGHNDRWLAYSGCFFLNNFRCPKCLGVQFAGFQDSNQLIKCKKCKESSKCIDYKYDSKRGKICPKCNVSTLNALNYYQNSKEFKKSMKIVVEDAFKFIYSFACNWSLWVRGNDQTFNIDDFLTSMEKTSKKFKKLNKEENLDKLVLSLAKFASDNDVLGTVLNVTKGIVSLFEAKK